MATTMMRMTTMTIMTTLLSNDKVMTTLMSNDNDNIEKE